MLRRVCRALMAGIFISEGVEAIRNPLPSSDAAAVSIPGVDEADVPSLLRAGGWAQIAGGTMLVLDIAPRTTATVLAASLVPATAAGPRQYGDAPVEKAERRRLMLRNLALFGSLVLTAMDTQGKPSIAWRAGHVVDHAGMQAEWRAREAALLGEIAKLKAGHVAAGTKARTIAPAKQAAKDAKRALRAAGRAGGVAAGAGKGAGRGARRVLSTVTPG